MNPDEEPLYKAFIGPGWDGHYRAAFERAAGGRSIGWNGAAAIVPGWLAFRRFVLGQVVSWVGTMFILLFVIIAADGDPATGYSAIVVVLAAMGALQGATADAALYRRARALMAHKRFPADPDARAAWMAKRGGCSALGPAVAVGAFGVVVWAIIYPKFGHQHHERPLVAMLKSDLRNLVTAQESYFADHLRYSAHLGDSAFRASDDVVITIDSASDSGWAASARDAARTIHCVIFVGPVPPTALDGPPLSAGPIPEGEPKCTRRLTHDAH